MKIITIGLVLTIVAIVNGATTQEEFFDQLTSSEFGKTILQTLQIELKQNNAIDAIVQQLKQMRDGVISDQAEAQQNIQSRQSDCSQNIVQIDEVVALNEAKVADENRQFPLLLEQGLDKQSQSVQKNQMESRNLDRLARKTQNRADSRAEYENSRNTMIGQIATLKEAKTIVGQLKAGSFLQSSTEAIFTEMKEHHQAFIKSFPKQRGHHQLVSLLLETLSDSSLQSNQNLVQALLDIIDQIIEGLYTMQQEELAVDDQRQLDFLRIKTRILAQNDHLQHSIATLNAAVLNVQQKILELQNDINTKQAKTDWLKTCSDASSSFAQGSINRLDKNMIIIIIQKK